MQTGTQSDLDRTAIIVSGMHHAGVSLTAQLLSLLGAVLPDELLDPGDADGWVRGEGGAIVNLDDLVLERLGSWWAGWEQFDEDELLGLVRLVERARRVVREHYGEAELVVLQDPRFARLLPLWEHALEQEGFRCVHVVVLRQPGAIVRSLRRREGLRPRAAALSWLAHTLDAERQTCGRPRVFVSFEDLLADWRSEADRIASALALTWPERAGESSAAIDDLFDAGVVDATQQRFPKGPTAAISPVHEVFRRWSRDDVRNGDVELLESWRAALSPIRAQRSAAARAGIEYRNIFDHAGTRNESVARLGAPQVWSPIQSDAHNLEADSAWAWLLREHGRAVGHRASAKRPRMMLRVLPSTARRLSRRLPLRGNGDGTTTSGGQERRERGHG